MNTSPILNPWLTADGNRAYEDALNSYKPFSVRTAAVVTSTLLATMAGALGTMVLGVMMSVPLSVGTATALPTAAPGVEPQVGAGASAKEEIGACFFERPGFAGAYFCNIEPGVTGNVEPWWQDRIQSVMVFEGTTLDICQAPDGAGQCRRLTDDTPRLSPRFANNISSFQIDG